MINAIKLQEKIIANPDKILEILEGLEFTNIKDRGSYLQFANKDGDNQSAISLLKSTLHYENYTRGKTGNLFTLVMDEKKLSFTETLNWICKCIGEDKSQLSQTIHYPFNSFYKQLLPDRDIDYGQIKTYSIDRLPMADSYSKMFADDGISISSQEKFGVRYSHEDDAILIPIHNLCHEMVGVKARNNNNNDYNNRWYAWLPYSKTRVVYGLDMNYREIVGKKTLIIYEAEKSVMQSDTFGLNCTGAVAGHSISDTQAKIIKSMMADRIILAFDEGLEQEEIEFEAKKLLVNNPIYKNQVYYLYDKANIYLPKGSKDSPSDLGKPILQKMLKNCKWEVSL